MFYVDNNSFCELGNTAEFKDFFCWFSSESYLRRSFFTKIVGCFLPTAILPKMNFFCRFFKNFDSVDQSLLSIAFTQVVIREKVCFIKTTSFNYSFTETSSIQRNPFCRSLVGTHY